MLRLFLLLSAVLAGLIALDHGMLRAAPPSTIRQSVAVCDPNAPGNCDAPEGKFSYSGATAEYEGYSGTTDWMELCGSSTKTVVLRSFYLEGHADSAAHVDVILAKRSSAGSGGGPATLTAVPHDSNNPSATASLVTYTTTPTSGDVVGLLRSGEISLVAVASGGALHPEEWIFGENQVQGVRLNSASECVTLGTSPAVDLPTGAGFHINLEWTEE